jgi:anti-sigma regulatory factor (Ser/Thr protein kinase)
VSLHSGGAPGDAIILTVEVLPETVRVRVRDTGPGFEHIPAGNGDRTSGWGLHLVESLSDRWGIERIPADGTSVWFELGRMAS